MADDNIKDNLINRLNRIEGQIRGVKNMIAQEKYCLDILHQIWAARAALNKTGEILLENYIRKCLRKSSEKDSDNEAVKELIKALKAMHY